MPQHHRIRTVDDQCPSCGSLKTTERLSWPSKSIWLVFPLLILTRLSGWFMLPAFLIVCTALFCTIRDRRGGRMACRVCRYVWYPKRA